MGDRRKNIETALKLIEQNIGNIINSSSIYETEPWGITDQPGFYNLVLQLQTDLSAEEVLSTSLDIEKKMGRIRHLKYGSRVIDIDILFYNLDILQLPHLTIPHPRISERNFVLAPLAEIAPTLVHPVLDKSIEQLRKDCTDTLRATILS